MFAKKYGAVFRVTSRGKFHRDHCYKKRKTTTTKTTTLYKEKKCAISPRSKYTLSTEIYLIYDLPKSRSQIRSNGRRENELQTPLVIGCRDNSPPVAISLSCQLQQIFTEFLYITLRKTSARRYIKNGKRAPTRWQQPRGIL